MDSYEVLGVSKESSDKEIEIAYEDLKRKYDPGFNTSIHAYKKYREILKAYESIKDEQRRKMYDLKDNVEKVVKDEKVYSLYDYKSENIVVEKKEIDYSKAEDFSISGYKNIEVNVEVSYLYYLLNLRYELDYFHNVRCSDCSEFVTCDICNGEKVVEYKEHLVWCPNCRGEGKVSVNCKTCGDSGTTSIKDSISFYVDEEVKEFKGYGDEYSNNLKSNLIVNFNFYDRENIKVKDDIIEVNYYLSKDETVKGINKEYFSEFGAFKFEVGSFVEDGYRQEINFNNKKLIFVFFNKEYNGKDKNMYLFINEVYKDKFIYFNDDYSVCSEEETVECSKMLKCESHIFVKDEGYEGRYGGNNGNLIIKVVFNNEHDLLYVDNVNFIETSKMFNMLGGNINGIKHYGFKGKNCLIKNKDVYYLLSGESKRKLKLKEYFVFKIISLILWCLIPVLIIIRPYNMTLFITLVSFMIGYFILINLIMEVEV